MIKRLPKISLFVLICTITLYACDNRISEKKIAILTNSQWLCDIEDDNYFGKQTLMFNKDGRFHQQDDLILASEDGGFEFQMNVSVFNEGEWEIVGDSLFIIYSKESLTVLPDTQTFHVRTVYNNIDIDGSIKEKMEKELSRYIDEDITRKYDIVSDIRVCFGIITKITKNTIQIKNGENFLKLKKSGQRH